MQLVCKLLGDLMASGSNSGCVGKHATECGCLVLSIYLPEGHEGAAQVLALNAVCMLQQHNSVHAGPGALPC